MPRAGRRPDLGRPADRGAVRPGGGALCRSERSVGARTSDRCGRGRCGRAHQDRGPSPRRGRTPDRVIPSAGRPRGIPPQRPRVLPRKRPMESLLSGIIEIPASIRDEMVAHARAELPNEACGLLAGPDGRIERFYAMRNADDSPQTYRLDPKEQFEVWKEIDDAGWEVRGVFHSHTHTQAYPSETDRSQASIPEAFYLLVSLADPERPDLRGFTIRDGEVEEHEVRTT